MGLDPISAFGAVAGGLLRGDIIRRQMDRQDMLDKLQADNASLRAAAAARKEQMDAMRLSLDAIRTQNQITMGQGRLDQGGRRIDLDVLKNEQMQRKRAVDNFLIPVNQYGKNPPSGISTPINRLRAFTESDTAGVPGTPEYNDVEGYFLANQKADDLAEAGRAADRLHMEGIVEKRKPADDRERRRIEQQIAKTAIPFARLKTDVEGIDKALAAGEAGFGFNDAVTYPNAAVRATMQAKAVQNQRRANNVFNWFLREGAGLAQTVPEKLNQIKGRLLASNVSERDFRVAWADLRSEIDKWQQAAFAGYPPDMVQEYFDRLKGSPIRIIEAMPPGIDKGPVKTTKPKAKWTPPAGAEKVR